ncbi:MAG: ORF6N domain-containing protein [Planctomycetes bacterium]|nr:ORF6N domain-containing protein [Planctomycetota bacterium]
MVQKRAIIPTERIERRILLIRGQKMILDADLAVLYGVPTKVLNQAVKRNRRRFPADFMFQLTAFEKTEVVTNCDHLARLKFSSVRPHAFTEHGAIMAATVLNTRRTIEVSVYVVRVFVKLREMLANHRTLAVKLNELERHVGSHDHHIQSLLDAIRQLMEPPPAASKRKKIGYLAEFEGK